MLTYIDITRTFTVPVSCAGAEDEIDIRVTMEVTANDDDEVWLEGVIRADGAHVSPLDSLFATAEAWVDDHADDILKGSI